MSYVKNGTPIGGTALPTASGAGQLPVSAGAGTTYAATTAGDVVDAAIASVVGAVAGQAIVGDGLGGVTETSADVSAMLAAANAAAARTALGVTTPSHTTGALAARPVSPAAGDTYAVTSGVGTGDRYQCFVAGAWTLVACTRDLAPTSGLQAEWRCDDARTGSGHTLVNAANPGTYDLTVGADVADSAGGPGVFGRAIVQPSADASTTSADGRKGAKTLEPASLTILAWVVLRAIPSPNSCYIALKRTDDSNWAGPNTFAAASLGVGTTGRLSTEMRTAANKTALDSTDQLQVGQPQLVAATFDGSTNTAALWIDGTAQGTLARGAALDYGSATDRSWSLAGNFQSTGATLRQRFPGSVERVRIYNRVLTAAEMIEIRLRGLGLYEGQ